MEINDPKIVDSFDDIEIYKKDAMINKIGVEAMKNEKEKNKRLGVPSPFMQNGKIFYELPDGTITTENPFKI